MKSTSLTKRVTALILAALTVTSATTLSSCGKKNENDKGAYIEMYVSSFPENLDPTEIMYGSSDNARLFGLLYDSLFTIDEDGKLSGEIADEWEYYVDARDNTLKLEITLNTSYWSDGIPVDADDFVYAFQRLLEPSNDNPNAALLYPIKNAKAVKEGLASVNDLGAYAIKDDVLQIAFENGFTNVEYFMRRLASPALVPLREENADKFDDESNIDYMWSGSDALALPLTNGAFKYRKISADNIEFERNLYYNGAGEDTKAADDKYVKPFRLITNYKVEKKSLPTPDDQIERYKNKEIFYYNLSDASADTLKEVKHTENMLPSAYAYFFDSASELFSDSRVRKALSISLNRDEITRLTGRKKAKAVTGIVPNGIEDSKVGSDFRKNGGDLFPSSGDMEQAKQLLSDAKVKKGNITIVVNKDRAYELDIADYVKEVWKELGFKVSVEKKNAKYIYGITSGATPIGEEGKNYVVAMDLVPTTSDAYSTLVGFSKKYGGHAFDITSDKVSYDNVAFFGFGDDDYDSLCDSFVNAPNAEARSESMHLAEEALAELSPVAVLFNNSEIYASRDLKNISEDFFGSMNFTKVSQKNYRKYVPEEREHVELPDAQTDDGEQAADDNAAEEAAE